ncbi:MAG: hypothetical protein ACT4QF_10775 [Sporichthyaceae bacterium]
MNPRNQVACAWAGFVGIAFILVGLIVGDYLPPPQASDTAEQVAEFYRESEDRIRAGTFIGLLATGGWGSLVAVTWVQMRRIEGPRPVLTALQVVSGAMTYVLLVGFWTFLSVAVFRPGRSPELTQALHDIGWFFLVLAVMPVASQALATGLLILGDDRPEPVFPRWLGHFGIWTAVILVPGAGLIFFKDGPMAYHGIVPFWAPLFAFGAWVAVLSWGCRRAALLEAAGPVGPVGDPVPLPT